MSEIETESQYLTADQIDAIREFIQNRDFEFSDISRLLGIIDNYVRVNRKDDEVYKTAYASLVNLEYLGEGKGGMDESKRAPFAMAASMSLFGLLSLTGVISGKPDDGQLDPLLKSKINPPQA